MITQETRDRYEAILRRFEDGELSEAEVTRNRATVWRSHTTRFESVVVSGVGWRNGVML